MQVLDGLEPFPTRSDYFFKQNIIPIYNTILTVVDQLTSHDFPNLKTFGIEFGYTKSSSVWNCPKISGSINCRYC